MDRLEYEDIRERISELLIDIEEHPQGREVWGIAYAARELLRRLAPLVEISSPERTEETK